METKWLTIQSFKRNQTLIDHVNKLLIHYKLLLVKKSHELVQNNIEESQNFLREFLNSILQFTQKPDSDKEAILGTDSRLRSFIRSFEVAKNKKRQFKSKLFKSDPFEIVNLIGNSKTEEEYNQLINALTELRTIVETHNTADLKELIEGI